MRRLITTVFLAGALALVPLAASAAQAAKPQPAAKHSSTKAAPTHATAGVVKSYDDSTLVITRTGKNAGEMTFTLNPSTQKKGTIAPGSTVSVRYRGDGSTNVATAITAQPQKKVGASH